MASWKQSWTIPVLMVSFCRTHQPRGPKYSEHTASWDHIPGKSMLSATSRQEQTISNDRASGSEVPLRNLGEGRARARECLQQLSHQIRGHGSVFTSLSHRSLWSNMLATLHHHGPSGRVLMVSHNPSRVKKVNLASAPVRSSGTLLRILHFSSSPLLWKNGFLFSLPY